MYRVADFFFEFNIASWEKLLSVIVTSLFDILDDDPDFIQYINYIYSGSKENE